VEYLLQILEQKQPKYFVFENVKGLMSKKFDEFRESIIERIYDA
jgi:site-specific DNA-cytosine methylase